jgi:prevent-host-death family protein
MPNVSIRDLRNHAGDVVERAVRGERLVITRSGKPIAQLTALPPAALPLHELIARRRHLPPVDPEQCRSDIDRVLDPSV